MRKLNIVAFGVGIIGSLTSKYILEDRRDRLNVVGAFDVDPNKVGKDLGEVVGLGKKTGIKVSNELGKVLGKNVDVVIHTTTSFFKKAYPQIESVVKRKVDLVSSCEELSYPYYVDRGLAKKLDSLAKRNGVTVLGTGINPGFLMDTLPITLTAPCKTVKTIKVSRRMNAATRRVPFQKKVGAGLTAEEFKKAIEAKAISGHVGLEQSIAMIAAAVGWKLDKIDVGQVEPVIAKEANEEGYVRIEPGHVAGVMQSARGISGGRALIELNFMAYNGSREEYDAVEIDGVPPINCKISPCVHGDHGTVAMLANMVPKVFTAPPGLFTMKDLQVPSASV